MKVRPTNASAGDLHDCVAGIENGGVGYILDTHLFDSHITDCFHAMLLLVANVSLRFVPRGSGRVGSAILSTPVTKSRGPCGWPSMVGISPASKSASKRRRSWRMAKFTPLLRKLARAPMPGIGSYAMRALMSVPRPAGACSN